MNIFVGSLPFKLQEADLREIFEEHGEVASVKIITDKFSGRSKGFGFVEMPNDVWSPGSQLTSLNGAEVDGRAIVVNKAEERRESPRRDNFRNDHRGGYQGNNRRY